MSKSRRFFRRFHTSISLKLKNWIIIPLLFLFFKAKNKNAAPSKRVNAFFAHPVKPLIIRKDGDGDGNFGTQREGHLHRGIDYLISVGQPIFSPCDGVYLRDVRPYKNFKFLNGCDIQSNTGETIRIFYLQPILKANEKVRAGQIIAYAQDVRVKYEKSTKMLPHIHVEIWKDGKFTDPKNYFS
jgi:murein DD-endopeptidase MepM/ murein hydrolase activator NlpD